MRKRLTLVMVALAAAVALVQAAGQSGPDRVTFEAAKKVESVDGDLKAAIELYRKVAESKDPLLASQAHLRMAGIYRKLRDAQAQASHELLARNAADQGGAGTAPSRVASRDTPVTSLVTLDEPLAGTSGMVITPDGRYLSRISGLTDEIIITDLSTGKSERLEGGGAVVAMVSPDGQRIALMNRNQQTHDIELQVRDRRSNSRPTTILSSARAGQILTAERAVHRMVAWSADSRSILLTLGRADEDGFPLDSEIAILSVNDRGIRQIVSRGRFYPPDNPSLSPDGRYVAYSAYTSNSGALDSRPSSVYVKAIDGSSEKEIVRGSSRNQSPIWTEDGSHILFISDRGGSFGLYSVAVQNGEAKGEPSPVKGSQIAERVTPVPGVTPVAVTRGGVFYYVKASAGTDVWQLPLDPDGRVRGPSTRISDNFVNQLAGPAYSPTGDRIALFRQVGSNDFRLVVRQLDSGLERTYQERFVQALSPVWTPDGRGLLTNHVAVGIRRFDLEKESVTSSRQVAMSLIDGKPTFSPARGLVVSPDGTVYFIREHRDGDRIVALDLRDLANAKERDVWTAPDGVSLASIALDRDGRTFAITTFSKASLEWRPTPGSLARLGVEGTGYVELSKSVWRGAIWTPDGQAILFRDDRYRLMRIPARGGTPQFTGLTLTEVEFSVRPPTGSQIAFTEKAPTELWKIEKLSSVLKGQR